MRHGIFFEGSTANETGLILPNHLAASLTDGIGDRAQHISQSLSMPVLAYERPSTANLSKIPNLTSEKYLDGVQERAAKLQRLLGMYGISQAIICGNSAGALEALAIAASGEIDVKQVVLIEPVGMRQLDKSVTLAYVKDQLKADKTGMKGSINRELVALDPIRDQASKGVLARRIYKEAKVYHKVYSSGIGVELLRILAKQTPEVPVNLVLGEDSPTTTPELRNQLVEEFDGSSVNIDVIPHAGHSFADLHHQFIYLLEDALQPAREIN